MHLITEQPLWYLIFCLGLGATGSFILYRKEKLFTDIPRWVKWTMAGLRFITLSLIAFLLLSPMVKMVLREVEKPLILIAQDESESLLIGPKADTYKKDYPIQLQKLIGALEERYEVKTFSFGDTVSEKIEYQFTQKQTNISALFDALANRYINRNVGAVLLASDGLYNQGSNPLYAAEALKAPIFTIALGDTNVNKDIILKKVHHNKTAYLGNIFPLEITVDAKQCKGAITVLTVKQDSAILFRKVLEIGQQSFHTIIPVTMEARKKGMHQYRIQLSEVKGEVSTANNSTDVYIEVLESKEKILLLANAPHPDLAILRQAIESNQRYEVKVAFPDKFDGIINNYNLVILHQLPSKNNGVNALLAKIKSSEMPVLYILGSQSQLPVFNSLEAGISITENQNKSNDAQAYISNNFSLFTLSDELRNTLPLYPPLQSPFGTYKLNGNVSVPLMQQIGAVKSEQPLLVFKDDGTKAGVLAGEGIWRWYYRNYAEKSNHEAINELITKMVQYLSVRENKSHFRIIGKNNFLENEPILLDAEVYNDSYELINSADISIKMVNKDKKVFPFSFSKTAKAYTLNAGYLPVGVYNYSAKATLPGKSYTTNGIISISPLQVEASETVADHQLLYALAKKFNGELVFPNEMDKLVKTLLEREDIKPVVYSHKKLKELIHLKLLFFLILTLLAAEWIFRKRNGGY